MFLNIFYGGKEMKKKTRKEENKTDAPTHTNNNKKAA